ncbi:M16 family metallopeptidase [Streptomyces sp. NPDC048496]|uniref:M16 family metallopeptidase n=1 Tax=Streptomyces sp. NPDC048496 TaxID=3365558 RepID=UPI003717D95C
MNLQTAIHSTEVDGIPTLFTHATGPTRAGLVFRVGVADETLARTGVTHLVEHLALHRQGLNDHHFNGETKSAFTHFFVEGTEHEVVSYLKGVCSSLSDLPMERLETEKEILRTEESRRQSPQLPLWRYGARGYGLSAYPEWGMPKLDPDAVRHWARTWFTRGNAVLWVAGERLPAGLSLNLPAGERRPMPAVTSALPESPAYFSEGTGGVLLDAVVADTAAAMLYAGVLERELSRDLRQEGGYSYTAATNLTPRRDGFAVLTAFADALPAKQGAVLGGFVDVLARLQAGRVEQAGLDAVRARYESALTASDVAVHRLPGMAENLLAGRPPRTVDELLAELRSVTPAQVHEVALEAASTALMQVPSGHSADWAGYTAAPTNSSYTVPGRKFAALSGDGSALIVGDEGVSMTARGGDGSECAVTVRYQDCAAMLCRPDGGRQLIGADGLVVEVEPTLYGLDARALASVDAAVAPDAVVPLPARPRPPMPEDAAAASAPRAGQGAGRGAAPTRRTGLQTAVMILFGLLAGLSGLVALTFTLTGAGDPEFTLTDWIFASVVMWGFTGLLAWPAVRVLRQTRRL